MPTVVAAATAVVVGQYTEFDDGGDAAVYAAVGAGVVAAFPFEIDRKGCVSSSDVVDASVWVGRITVIVDGDQEVEFDWQFAHVASADHEHYVALTLGADSVLNVVIVPAAANVAAAVESAAVAVYDVAVSVV